MKMMHEPIETWPRAERRGDLILMLTICLACFALVGLSIHLGEAWVVWRRGVTEMVRR